MVFGQALAGKVRIGLRFRVRLSSESVGGGFSGQGESQGQGQVETNEARLEGVRRRMRSRFRVREGY